MCSFLLFTRPWYLFLLPYIKDYSVHDLKDGAIGPIITCTSLPTQEIHYWDNWECHSCGTHTHSIYYWYLRYESHNFWEQTCISSEVTTLKVDVAYPRMNIDYLKFTDISSLIGRINELDALENSRISLSTTEEVQRNCTTDKELELQTGEEMIVM